MEILSKKKGFKRFTLTKINKVNVKFGLIAIAHNFSKWIAKACSQTVKPDFNFTNELIDLLGRFLMQNLEHSRNYLEIKTYK